MLLTEVAAVPLTKSTGVSSNVLTDQFNCSTVSLSIPGIFILSNMLKFHDVGDEMVIKFAWKADAPWFNFVNYYHYRLY